MNGGSLRLSASLLRTVPLGCQFVEEEAMGGFCDMQGEGDKVCKCV